jgi:beta-N-acetylhexosaminidase
VLQHLRQTLGFRGVIVSDDVEMKALAKFFRPSDIGPMGIAAGIDVFLACEKPEVILELYSGLIHAIEREDITDETLIANNARILAWKTRFNHTPGPLAEVERYVGCAEHGALVEEIAYRSGMV